MKRRMLVVGLALITLGGCRTLCNKRSCNTCPPPPVIIGGPPVGVAAPTPEVVFPSAPPTTAPGQLAPVSPAPPIPSNSGYAPAPQFPTAGGVANLPASAEIRLERPEFSETSRSGVTTLKPASTSTPAAVTLTEVSPGRLTTGGRPTLDDLDRLQQAGYHYLLDVSTISVAVSAVDQQVYASRGLQLIGTAKDQSVRDGTYVFADDPKALTSWWSNYFRTVEYLSADAARVRAEALLLNR